MFFNKKKAEEEPLPVMIEAPAEPVEEPEAEPVFEQPEEKLSPINKTTIGKGIVFNGNFTGADPIEINGMIKGDIDTTCALTISETGSYVGNANIAAFESDGTVTGNIFCEDLAVLGEKSVMDGCLTTAFLTTKKGSAFSGTLEMCNAEKQKELKKSRASEKAPEDAAEEDEALEDLFTEVPDPEAEDEKLLKFTEDIDKNIEIPDFFDLSESEEKK